jgi:rfaE bifunctional protein nucleotidyltransferase chain/domain
MDDYRDKIQSLEDLKPELERIRTRGKRIVFTNGCFDLLHPGHVRYLWQARQLGDYLVVALNSDRSVRAIKGSLRPVMDEKARSEVVAALGFVDGVLIFDEDTPLRVIEFLLPDVLVKGGDWAEEHIVGGEVVKNAGGVVRVVPFVEGFSTTGTLRKIREKE